MGPVRDGGAVCLGFMAKKEPPEMIALNFEKMDGLVPAVVQDHVTGELVTD